MSDTEQSVLTWLALALVFIISRGDGQKSHPALRIFVLSLSAFITVRYLVWRATSTLVYTGPIDFIVMSLLFIAEVEVAVVYIMSMFTNIWPLKREHAPLPEDESLWPSVDVFIPTFTEDIEIVRITVMAATQIDYPADKLNIYILDDGGTAQRRNDDWLSAGAHYRNRKLSALAGELNVHYIARDKNQNAKAGNINHALLQTHGDIILVLDCDHVPTQDILQHTVGWFFKDPKLALVQTPHFFINPDPVERNLGSFHRAPSENEMFYRGIQPAIDFWNATFFCGSAALLKRTCIEEMGGLVGATIVEDCESSINMHANGYHSVYIDRPLVCGLSPDTFEDFLVQRTRWCQGMLQLGFLNNPTFKSGLSWPQRICYTSFYLYWFFGFARFVFFIAPSLFLLMGIQIYHASMAEAAIYALPHLLCSMMIMRYLFGRYRWPLFSELYESIQSLFLLPAVIGVVENPKSPSFKVTPKGRNLDHDYLSPLAGPFYGLFAIMIISVPTAIYQWFANPWGQDGIVICLVWLIINIGLTFSALGVFWERHQVREYPRAWADGRMQLFNESGDLVAEGTLRDLSLSGAGASVTSLMPLQANEHYYLVTQNSHNKEFNVYCTLRFYRKSHCEEFCGLEFEYLEATYPEMVNLVYGDSQRWADFWERPANKPSLMSICRLFLRMGAYGVRHSTTGVKHLMNNYLTQLGYAWKKCTHYIISLVWLAEPIPERIRASRDSENTTL